MRVIYFVAEERRMYLKNVHITRATRLRIAQKNEKEVYERLFTRIMCWANCAAAHTKYCH